MYMAFTYTDFDQDTPKRSFVGVFNSITDVHDIVIGTPYDRKNMCLINTETYEFREYVWVSTYINSFEFKKDGTNIMRLTHRLAPMKKYNSLIEGEISDELLFKYDGDTRKWGPVGNALLAAGEWEEER